jgi:hypothetical protein
MEALKLAFETVIVGALALPWLAFVLDLFFRPMNGNKNPSWNLWSFIKGETGKIGMELPAVASVFLFVAAYSMGVVVIRASGDFFNDEAPGNWPTEDHILKAAYCELAPSVAGEAWMTELYGQSIGKETEEAKTSKCGESLGAKEAIKRVFNLQESALLLEGGDKNDRLNQLHSQILVLRGAAFNALLTLALCVSGLLGRLSYRRVCGVLLMIAALSFGVWILADHGHGLDDPPFMEVTCMLLGLAGGYVCWKGAPKGEYGAGLTLSVLAFVVAFLGWWWSELLYDREVFYSFYAESHHLLGLVK